MTDRDRQIAALNEAFAHKFHSLAQYIAQARPYVRPGQEAALREIEAIAAEDARQAESLAEAIEALEGIPHAGLHAASVAELNYLSLDYLLRVLIEAREKDLRQYETLAAELAAELAADGASGALFTALREAAAAQLQRLRARTAPAQP